MTGILSKPANQIDINDINSLIDLGVPEGEQIEFKEGLPMKKGAYDSWVNNNKISDRGKRNYSPRGYCFFECIRRCFVVGHPRVYPKTIDSH